MRPSFRRVCAVLLVLAGGGLLSACAGRPMTDLSTLPPMPQRAEVANVPFYPQEERYCGPASLAMVLAWSGEDVGQEDVAGQVYTPGRKGTLRSDMLSAARRHHRLAVEVNSIPALLKELQAGHPVIVFQNRGISIYPLWHYAVAIGYDLSTGYLILHSGTRERHTLDIGAFERTWARGDYWGLVVLKPGELPASGTVWDVLAAAAALERVDDKAGAATAYSSIVSRWPDNWAVHFARGNLSYGQGDLEDAAADYRRAVSLNAQAAEAWNNLALVLHEMGRREEATDAAKAAVAAAGDEDRTQYQATLEQVSAAD